MGDGGEATGGVAIRSEEGRDETGGSAEGRSEREGASLPIDGGIMTSQPRKTQHELEVGQVDKLKGNLLCVLSMNPDAGVVEVCDRSSRAAINEFDGDGLRVGLGLQQMLPQKGGVQKSARGTGVNQGEDRDGETARNENVNGKGKVTGSGEGEGMREGKHSSQPGPYWLGREFFDRSGGGAGGDSGSWE